VNLLHAERPLTKWTADHPSVKSYKSNSPIKAGVVKREAAEWREVVIGIETNAVEKEEAALLKETADSEIGVELAQEDPASIAVNQVICK